jgi:hypothetical protein
VQPFLIFLLLVLPLKAFTLNSKAEEPKDTLRPLMFYGYEYRIKASVEYSDAYLLNYLDSLFNQPSHPQEIAKNLELYLTINQKSDEEIFHLIDSLFDSEDVPIALINQLNFLVGLKMESQQEGEKLPVSIAAFYNAANSISSHYCFHEGWDTKLTNPYPEEAWRNDTLPVQIVLTDSLNPYFHPHQGIVTSHFGYRKGRNHNGIDIDLNTGEPVKAAFSGIVRVATYHGGYGNVVIIRHHNGVETLYAHLHRIKVTTGQEVKGGQLIGLGGSTGRSTGAHLHFEIRYKGKPLNPRHFIDFESHSLIAPSFLLQKNSWAYNVYPTGSRAHVVGKGEYLHGIAQRYGITVNRICELNGISRNSSLQVGQKLLIQH